MVDYNEKLREKLYEKHSELKNAFENNDINYLSSIASKILVEVKKAIYQDLNYYVLKLKKLESELKATSFSHEGLKGVLDKNIKPKDKTKTYCSIYLGYKDFTDFMDKMSKGENDEKTKQEIPETVEVKDGNSSIYNSVKKPQFNYLKITLFSSIFLCLFAVIALLFFKERNIFLFKKIEFENKKLEITKEIPSTMDINITTESGGNVNTIINQNNATNELEPSSKMNVDIVTNGEVDTIINLNGLDSLTI